MKNIAREDRRVARQNAECEAARRKLMPVMVIVCETYGVTPDDLLSQSHHPHVVTARNIVTWLGWDHCKIGTNCLARILKKDRTATSKKLTQLRAEVSRGVRSSFGRQVDAVLRKLSPQQGGVPC